MRTENGFTLIEILVALFIVALVVTLSYETFNGVLRSTRQVDELSELDQMVRVSMGTMVNELKSAYWRPPGDNADATPYVFIGQDNENAENPSDTIRFTMLSHARAKEGGSDPSVSILEYELIPVPQAETAVLMHTEETNYLSLSENTLERFELAEQVVGLNFRYYDGKEWLDQWSALDRKKLPKAVEIEIIFKDSGGQKRQFITQTDIPLGQAS